MTRNEMFAAVRQAGLIPVPVSREGDAEEVLDYFVGDLPAYLAAAKETGARAILVMEYPLEEDRFFYAFDDDPTGHEDEEAGGQVEEVDLAEYLPELAKYKRLLGETFYYFLIAKGGAADLCFVLDQEWAADFENEIERAEGMALLARRKGR